NQYLIDLTESDKIEETTAVACFNQTKGRGQKGNVWFSEANKNINYSIIIYPSYISARNQFIISQAIALAVKSFLDEFTKNISIKWPNDIYWNKKKIAGTLIESQLKGDLIAYSVIGIGININQDVFPDYLPDAVSLKQITGIDYDLKDLIIRLDSKISAALEDLSHGTEVDIQRFYLNNLYRRDGFHSYQDVNSHFTARIRGISAQGNLILEHEDGKVKDYAFKEVVFI
ncbi:MAG: biotin--[acetyl-CoA-carboxylase] ligase, partial [Bacteroidales bacterium]|nr:biotin--[acetyl-CoA-carboxylase] ligase [Bacteroidales bacterium]